MAEVEYRVVLVEDAPAHRRLIEVQALLLELPLTIVTSFDEFAVVCANKQLQVSGVLTDLILRDDRQGGIRVLAEALGRWPNIPAALMSASGLQSEEILRARRELPTCSFIAKSGDMIFLSHVQKLFASAQAFIQDAKAKATA